MIIEDREKVRREASVPVQSRIDIRTLAEICQYFADGGAMVTTASQLVSWSLEVLVETLKRNGKVRPEKPSIEAASQFLESNGLMQKRMKKRKLTMAEGFEELRMEGVDPRMYAGDAYKSIHNNPNWTGKMPRMSNTQDTQTSAGDVIDKSFLNEAVKTYNEISEKDIREKAKEEVRRVLANADVDENGVVTPHGFDKNNPKGIVDEEFMEKIEEERRLRDEEEKRKEKEAKAIKKRNREREKLMEKLKELGEKEEFEDLDASCQVRKRSDEEILEDRVRKDKEQERLLSELDEVPSDGVEGD